MVIYTVQLTLEQHRLELCASTYCGFLSGPALFKPVSFKGQLYFPPTVGNPLVQRANLS